MAMAPKIPRLLKQAKGSSLLPIVDPSVRSDTLHASLVPSSSNARDFYLHKGDLKDLPPPLISHSEFIPSMMVEHLMRKKKDSALGVKYVQKRAGSAKPDEITNMEGALHTFVTPVVSRVEMIGDYIYQGMHGVSKFGDVVSPESGSNVMLTRSVVLSASIHLDFESQRVMLKVCKLDFNEVIGSDLSSTLTESGWKIPSPEEKQNSEIRDSYDESLRRHMVFHLTQQGRLPARDDVEHVMTFHEAIMFLEQVISCDDESLVDDLVGKYTKLPNKEVISLELLFNASVHQVRNEFSALKMLCPQGYVYTYDPASIFAQEIGPALLNRLMLAALKYISNVNTLYNLKIFAFNDYAEPNILGLVTQSLRNQDKIHVINKAKLFREFGNRYGLSGYEDGMGAMLVVHNNSDGFGQNIETEGQFGSLDGAIGANSSAAASLERSRQDLTDFVL